MKWTEQEITDWATQTFGEPDSPYTLVERAEDEFDELYYLTHKPSLGLVLADMYIDKNKVIEECADIVIVLTQVVNRLGGNLSEAVNDKMNVNSMRTWIKTGDGTGQHVDIR